MTRNETIGLCGLILVAVGGAFTAGELNGRIDGLGPDRIRDAQDEALTAIDVAVTAFESNVRFVPATETWTWNQYQDSEPVPLIRVSEGVCYLVHVEGQFEGQGESVTILQRDGRWYLTGTSGRDGRDIEATAACWPFPRLNWEH